jgi:hypothetical protein
MNKNFLKVPTDIYWALPDTVKPKLLAELKRRVEVLS